MAVRNKPLTAVFADIQQQTGYQFFYDNKVVRKGNKVTVDIRSGSIVDVMDAVMKGATAYLQHYRQNGRH